MGKWHAEILNEQDAAFETFLPISVREIYELLLAFPENERKDAASVWELINRSNPILNFWGANEDRNIYEQWRDDKLKIKIDSAPKSTPSSRARTTKAESDVTLYLPKNDFLKEEYTDKPIYKVPSHGALTFTVDQPYRKPTGVDYFQWEILLNGRSHIKCDGALTTTPTTVTFWNLKKNDEVKVRIAALRDGPQDSSSWERASRTTIRSIKFYAGNLDGDENLRIGCDNPYANILERPLYREP